LQLLGVLLVFIALPTRAGESESTDYRQIDGVLSCRLAASPSRQNRLFDFSGRGARRTKTASERLSCADDDSIANNLSHGAHHSRWLAGA
jgi:hypothetical protein